MPSERPAWRVLLDATSAAVRQERGNNYVQLATVDAAGHPRNRTVVFRGYFDHPSGRSTLTFITDVRAAKAAEVDHAPWGEVVWWFPKSSEQFRIAGRLELVRQDHTDPVALRARRDLWETWTDRSRETMYGPPPGSPYNPEDVPKVPTGGRSETGAILPVPDTFAMLLLWPERVDHLRLTESHREVHTLNEAGSWTSVRVNP
jgi:pyridoxamine 5'-phosphate oxidase